MGWTEWLRFHRRRPAKRALVLAGGGVILEQSTRITSRTLLDLGLRQLQSRHPKVEILLLQPEAKESPLFGPSMGFEASRAALRFGYTSTQAWLRERGKAFVRRFHGPEDRAVRARTPIPVLRGSESTSE